MGSVVANSKKTASIYGASNKGKYNAKLGIGFIVTVLTGQVPYKIFYHIMYLLCSCRKLRYEFFQYLQRAFRCSLPAGFKQ